jgi:hypothetical protein
MMTQIKDLTRSRETVKDFNEKQQAINGRAPHFSPRYFAVNTHSIDDSRESM